MILARDVLFYPDIDITKSKWLRTGLLTWENITTIVPHSFADPYTNSESKAVYEAGILKPHYVSSDNPEVLKTERLLIQYFLLDHIELFDDKRFEDHIDHVDRVKLLDELGQRASKSNAVKFINPTQLYLGKLSPTAQKLVLKLIPGAKIYADRLRVPEWFANHYMTFLASTIAYHKGQSIWGETRDSRKLSNDALALVDGNFNQLTRMRLASFALRTVDIRPDVPIEKILKFRAKHEDERRRFREEINRLTDILDVQYEHGAGFEAAFNTIYRDHVEGAINDLRKALKSFEIPHSVAVLSMLTLANAANWINDLSRSESLLATALSVGIAAGVQYANYRGERFRQMQASPFSYVLIGENELGKPK